jgi:hypothetical protein
MAGECTTKRRRGAVVKQYLHVEACCSRHETSLGMAQHEFNLLSRYRGEPFQEFLDPGAIFEILKQRPHRHAAVLK